MKRIFFFMALLVSCMAEPCQAQRLYEHVHNMFTPLDKTEIQSGILIEQTPVFIWPGHYNGQNTADSMRLSLDHFGMLYGQFRNAIVNNSETLPEPTVFLRKKPALFQKSDTINLALMAMEYNYIHLNAIDDNLITWSNGQFFDVPERTTSPYRQDTSFTFIALNQRVEGLTFQFVLPQELLFNNLNWDFAQVEIDFDNGRGFNTVTPSQIMAVTYDSIGIKTIRLQYPRNGQVVEMVTFIDVKESIGSAGTRSNTTYEEDNPEIIPLPGMNLSIFSSCEDGKVRKPLIVLEGFAGEQFDFGSMFGLLKTGKTTEQVKLIDYLNANEHDLIYIDYIGSVDNEGIPTGGSLSSIPTNANYLINALEWINARKHADGSGEPNVLIGNSMGGLVGKLAILKMHNQLGMDSEIERFFTFDAPMKGANFPIGIQAFIRDLIDQAGDIGASTASLEESLLLLDSDSAKDLLKHRVRLSYPNNSPNPQLSVNTWDFDAFQTIIYQLEAIRPFNEITRHIAVSNGADNGVLQESIQGNDVLEDAMKILSLYIRLDHEIGNDNNANLYDIEIFADAYSAVNPYDLRYLRQFVINPIVGGNTIEGEIELSVTNDFALDNAPGGMSNLGLSQINNALSELTSALHQDVDEIEATHYQLPLISYCFVPTVSGLDMDVNTPPNTSTPTGGTVVQRWSTSDDNLSQSPYSDQQEFNQDHVSINTRIADLIVSELSPTNPFTPLASPLINGEIYNFGQAPPPLNGIPSSTAPSISTSLTIQDGGELWINRDDRLSYTNLNTVTNNHPRTHVVTVPGINCDEDLSADVVIETGGKIIIGDYENNIFNSGHLNFGKHSALTVNGLDAVYVDKKSKLSFSGGSSLLINPNSRIETRDKAHFGIHGGAQATIESTGRLELNEETTATISGIGADGNPSRLHVRAGATLRASTGSQIIVESGGILEIDAGANIDLWWSESNIHIKDGGELIINGDFSFVGKGFFQFSAGNTLTFTDGVDGLTLVGQGKGTRFIHINSGVLDIGDHVLNLSHGAVTGGPFYSSSGADINFYDMDMTGNGSLLHLSNPNRVNVRYTDFSDYNLALNIQNFDDQNQIDRRLYFLDCNFDNCLQGAEVTNTSEIGFYGCTFESSSIPLHMTNVEEVVFSTSQMLHPSGGFNGIRLDNTSMLRMSGSTIDNYDIGIHVPESSILAENKSNVIMSNGAKIQNCNQGIFINKGGIDQSEVDYGLVSMKCAKLINNGVGIAGVDILLDIDGCIDGDPTCNAPYYNTFDQGAVWGDYFDICYYDRDDIEIVFATHNYWSSTPYSSSSSNSNYSIKRISNLYDCQTIPTAPTTPINLDASDPITQLGSCGPNIPNPNPNPNESAYLFSVYGCDITAVNTQDILPIQYGKAFYDYKNEDKIAAYNKFAALAAVPNNVRDVASPICRQYIDVARVMRHALSSSSGVGLNSGAPNETLTQKDETGFEFKIAPNPATNLVRINASEGKYRLLVFDLLGRLQTQTIFEEVTTVNIVDWQSGIYLIKIVDLNTNEWQQEKLVVSNNRQ